jgi:hypothetical protein
LLKFGAQIQTGNAERKLDIFASQECCNLVGNKINLGAGRRYEIGKVGLDKLLGRDSVLGEQSTPDFRLFTMNRPEDGH